MIEKIKNFMSNNTTDLVSYSDEDDYSNFWKDLKPIKYESPKEILKKYVDKKNKAIIICSFSVYISMYVFYMVSFYVISN